MPGKVLKRVGGRPILSHVLERAGLIPGVDEVVLTTTPEREDLPLTLLCTEAGVTCTRGQGPLAGQPGRRDVLAGYALAARETKADVVVRITSDCPLLDPAVAGLVLDALLDSGALYASNVHPPTWFDGCDVEVFTRGVLERAAHDATPSEREHVTTYMYRAWSATPYLANGCPVEAVVNVRAPGHLDVSALKLSVDDHRDLERVRRVYAALRPGARGWRDVLEAYHRTFPSVAEVRARELYGDGRSHGAEPLRAAFVAGAAAVIEGTGNPYPDGSPLSAAWTLGRADAAGLGYGTA